CDTDGPVRGDHGAFFEMFERAQGPAQIVVAPNHPVAPCAPCLLEQFTRTEAESRAIIADLQAALAQSPIPPTAEDWLFAGSFAATISASPMRDRYPFLTPGGVRHGGQPAWVLLSLNAEGLSI